MDHHLDAKEKVPLDDVTYDSNGSHERNSQEFEGQVDSGGKLSRNLKGRHMQMIAIGMKFLRNTSVAILAIAQTSTADSLTSQAVPLALVSSSVLVQRSIMVDLPALYVIIESPRLSHGPQSWCGDAAQADHARSTSFSDSSLLVLCCCSPCKLWENLLSSTRSMALSSHTVAGLSTKHGMHRNIAKMIKSSVIIYNTGALLWDGTMRLGG